MRMIRSDAPYATFINVFKYKPGHQDDVVRINAEIIDQVGSSRPGCISASLHRSLDGTRVFNYLQWESAEHRRRRCRTAQPRRRLLPLDL